MGVRPTTVDAFAPRLSMRSDEGVFNLGFCEFVITAIGSAQLIFSGHISITAPLTVHHLDGAR